MEAEAVLLKFVLHLNPEFTFFLCGIHTISKYIAQVSILTGIYMQVDLMYNTCTFAFVT